MNRRSACRGFLAAAVVCGCFGFCAAIAGERVKTIPLNQPPLLRTFPASATEQTPSGAGKFVIFTREQIKTNKWNFIAGAWECIPSQTNVPITKRVEFCHSSWSANVLLHVLSRDNREGTYPRFVRLQVDSEDDDGRVNLYDINYRTWDVRCLWQGRELFAFGVMKNWIYCMESSNWFRMDARSGEISRIMPFLPWDVDGDFWIVRKVGEKSGCWSYDRNKEQFIGHFGHMDEPWPGDTKSLLSPDGKSRAWVLVRLPKGDWARDAVSGTFLLQRDSNTNDIRVPITLTAIPGSGRPLIPIGTALRFTADGNAEFSAIQKLGASKESVWTINPKSGAVKESVRECINQKDASEKWLDDIAAPGYLRPHLKDLQHFGSGALAPAFLMHLGILTNQPAYPDCAVGASSRHILFKAKEGRLADVFIYGDLVTRETVRFPQPAGMQRADSLEIVWVETP